MRISYSSMSRIFRAANKTSDVANARVVQMSQLIIWNLIYTFSLETHGLITVTVIHKHE